MPAGPVEETERLKSAERSMVVARWVAVAFAVLQVTTYDTMPYPAGVQSAGYLLVALLALGNVGLHLGIRRVRTVRRARRLVAAGLAFDVLLASGFVWLYAFDAESSLFLVLFVLPAEGALKFAMRGALLTWFASAVLYAGREWWAAERYDHPLSIVSINFRMGVLLILAIIIGSLARNLARRTEELRGTVAELQRVEAWRGALIDMLAHDIRSPVGGASSTMTLISQRVDDLDGDRIRELAESAIRQNARALRLADDLLDIARARQGRLILNREEVDVVSATRQVVEQFQRPEDVIIAVPEGLRAKVDPQRFEQILTNLLSNAFKHGLPPVEVSASARPDGGITLRVTDHGEGVPSDERDALFSPFATGSRADSVGLGLWVVDTLAVAHGGSAVYDPDEEGRPSFVVELAGTPS